MPKDTILILDNDFHCQRTLKALLESEKYIALVVDQIGRALKNFQEFEISALIAEYRFDHLLLEVIWQLKKRFPELYVMMLTNENLGEKEYKKAIHVGVDDVFLKPISGEKILVHLNKGLRQRRMLLYKSYLEQNWSHRKAKKEAEILEKKLEEKTKPYHEKYSIHPT